MLRMREFRKAMLVISAGRGGHHRVDQLGLAVHTEVHLHAEVPLIALLAQFVALQQVAELAHRGFIRRSLTP